MKMTRRLWLLVLTCCLLANASADDKPKLIATTLRVGVSPVFPPMIFKKDKKLAGVEVDLAHELAEQMGLQAVFVELPWEEQVEALNAGKIDIIMSSMSITQARKWVVDFSQPYLVVGQMPLVRREDQNLYVFGFPIRPPGKMGALKATTGDFLLQREFPKATRKIYKSESQAVEALKKKNIDLFISDSTLVSYLAGVHSSEGLVAVPLALSEEPLGWAVRKGDEKTLKAANEFIQKSIASGKLNQVFKRWMALQ